MKNNHNRDLNHNVNNSENKNMKYYNLNQKPKINKLIIEKDN